jgi:hypothetical protein
MVYDGGMVEQKLKRHEDALVACMAEIERLRAENERLTSALDAHAVLQSIYRDATQNGNLRVKAASAALPVEKPKLHSIVPPMALDRREAWRVYQRWRLRTQIVLETRNLPTPGWDAHLIGDSYEPPEGDDMPPVRVVSDLSRAFGSSTV